MSVSANVIYSHLGTRHLSNKGIDTWPDSVVIKGKIRLNDVFLITEQNLEAIE